MNTQLFEKIGLNNLDLSYLFIGLFVFAIIMTVLVVVEFVQLNKLKKTYKKFMTGKNVKSLENEIINLFDDNKFMKEQIDRDEKNIHSLNRELKLANQKMALIHYDAFKEMGGNLSFCLAMLNDNNDGFILNSVHSSAGCYSYIKEIKGGRCEIDLGAEEQKALDEAISVNTFGIECS